MDDVQVPSDLWRDLKDFFLPMVRQCKSCLRGNPFSCWQGDCPAFRFRNIARRIQSVQDGGARKPRYVLVEDEILSALAMYDRPVPPSYIVLNSTSSKANKYSAVKRLVRMGRVAEVFVNGRHMISLPKKEPENETTTDNNNTTSSGGAARRGPARQLGAGSPDARRGSRAD